MTNAFLLGTSQSVIGQICGERGDRPPPDRAFDRFAMGPDGAGARPPRVVDLVCGGITGPGGEKKELKVTLTLTPTG